MGRVRIWLGAAFTLLELVQPIEEVLSRFAIREAREEIRPLVGYYMEHKQAGDLIYCYYRSYKAYSFYTHMQNAGWIEGVSARSEPSLYLEDLEQLRGGGRVWIVFSHVYQHEDREVFLPYLEQHGERLDALHRTGASLCLYRL
jgi:hypothetical protein